MEYPVIVPSFGLEFREGAWWVLRFTARALPTAEEILDRIAPYFPKRGGNFAQFVAEHVAWAIRRYPRATTLNIQDERAGFAEARWIKLGNQLFWMMELSLYDREFKQTEKNPLVELRVVPRSFLAIHLRLIFGEEVMKKLFEHEIRKIERYIERHGLVKPPKAFIRRVLYHHFTWEKHIFQHGLLVIISSFIIFGSRLGWYRMFEPDVNREFERGNRPFGLASLFRIMGIPLPEKPTREELEAALILAVMEGKLKEFNFEGAEDEE